MPKVLFQDTRESSTDSENLLFCDSPALSPLINDICDDDDDDGLSTTIHWNGKKDVHESGTGVEPTCQVTQSFSKQFRNLHDIPTMID